MVYRLNIMYIFQIMEQRLKDFQYIFIYMVQERLVAEF